MVKWSKFSTGQLVSWCTAAQTFQPLSGQLCFQWRCYSSRRFSELLLKLIYFSSRKSTASLLFPLLFLFSLSSDLLSMLRMFLARQSVYLSFHCSSLSISVCPSMCFRKNFTMRNVSSDCCLENSSFGWLLINRNRNKTQIIPSKSLLLEPLTF